MTSTVEAFGIIAVQKDKVLLVHHQKGHWAFPKGHAEAGELPVDTAKRELTEETGLVVTRLLGPTFEESYHFDQTDKRVTYFAAEVSGSLVLQAEEIREARWVRFEDAEKLATFPECKRLCQKINATFS